MKFETNSGRRINQNETAAGCVQKLCDSISAMGLVREIIGDFQAQQLFMSETVFCSCRMRLMTFEESNSRVIICIESNAYLRNVCSNCSFLYLLGFCALTLSKMQKQNSQNAFSWIYIWYNFFTDNESVRNSGNCTGKGRSFLMISMLLNPLLQYYVSGQCADSIL